MEPLERCSYVHKALSDIYLQNFQATVIGGGYIGLETAAALSLNGLDVTIVFPENRFMERLFTPEIADFYENFYANKGIHIIKQDTATSFEGENGKVASWILCDFLQCRY